jgi:protein-disulfide isomerase
MSGRRDREARREERQREEASEAGELRRRQLIKLGSAMAFLTLVVVAVLIVLSAGQSDGGDTNLEGTAQVRRLLSGIPQQGMVLGEPGAKVTLVEFGDLQCPVCKGYAEEVLPPLIEGQVAEGKAKIEFRNYTIIGPQSTPAGAAAIAAGEQGRGWNFVELFYRNQGIEDSGYATDSFLQAIAKGAGVRNLAKWNSDRKSKLILAQVAKTTAEAEGLGFTGTPSFAIEDPGASGLEPLGTPGSAGDLESAIANAS